MEHMEKIEQVRHRIEKSKGCYMDRKIPEGGIECMKAAICRTRQEKKRLRNRQNIHRGIWMILAAVLTFVAANYSAAEEGVLQKLPVVGWFFEAITVLEEDVTVSVPDSRISVYQNG